LKHTITRASQKSDDNAGHHITALSHRWTRLWSPGGVLLVKASRVKVTDQDARYDPRFDFVVNDPEDKGRDTNFLATVLEQSRLNRIAAIYTALAILFQAAASSPLIESWIRR
jgi:hypothetical protein